MRLVGADRCTAGPVRWEQLFGLRGDQQTDHKAAASVQEEVSDARGLDPGDVGSGAGENAGFVLHGAADGTEAHHAVHLPAVPPQLAQQGAARVALGPQHGCQTTSLPRRRFASNGSSPGRRPAGLPCL